MVRPIHADSTSRRPGPRRAGLRVLLVAATAPLIAGLWQGCSDAPDRGAPIEARIRLENRCGIPNSSFAVVVDPSGLRVAFDEGGRLEMQLARHERVRLAASSRYPGFAYDGGAKAAAPEIELTADCGVSERMRETMESIRGGFERR